MKNYYEILEIDKNASMCVIKGVYKIHIKANHPDLFQGDEKIKAEEKIKLLNEAYETLSNKDKRIEYDKLLKEHEEGDKELLEEVLKENEILKEMLGENKKYNDIQNDEVKEFKSSNDYVPDPNVTDENNTKYLMKLIWKERALRFVIYITFVIAIGVGIYKASGINILSVFVDTIKLLFP